jgi:hypothetical protein
VFPSQFDRERAVDKDSKFLAQMGGFLSKTAARANDFRERADGLRKVGNDTAARAFETRATNLLKQVEKAGQTVKDRSKDR